MMEGAALPVTLVVAMAENRVIGREGGLPWRLSDDLKHFKRVTEGKPVVMGRTTYESIGRPLPGRTNIVLSRNEGYAPMGVVPARDLGEALSLADDFAREEGAEEVCVIGGGTIYEQALPWARTIWLTVVEAEVAGDTSFPALDPDAWDVEVTGRIAPDDRNDHPARIERWTRRADRRS